MLFARSASHGIPSAAAAGGCAPAVWRFFAAAGLFCVVESACAQPNLSYLERLRDATPAGGWVKASAAPFSSAWTPIEQRNDNYLNPASIAVAWASMAWDSTQGQLMLWGGGHANYMGNDMYLWSGVNGTWQRGSLPSAITGPHVALDNSGWTSANHYFVTDNAAPQSAHTYDNNVYLRQNNLFMTFGGAAFNTGSGFMSWDPATGQTERAGAWMWDPLKANPDLTGGVVGALGDQYTGAVTPGNRMWLNRAQALTPGSDAGSGNHLNGTTAYRVEDGRDVVYVTMAGASSGYRSLYRYQVGRNVRAGDLDSITLVGVSSDLAPAGQATATLDSQRNLYVHTTSVPGFAADLGVWDLSPSAQARGSGNANRPVELVREDGSGFDMTTEYAIEFDESRNKYVLWDARSQGLVWETEAAFDDGGDMLGTWVIRPLLSTSGLSQPSGALAPGDPGASTFTGVMGKWKYVPELQAFLALNEFNTVTQDAEVWLYRPLGGSGQGAGPGGVTGPNPGGSSGTVPAPATLMLVLTALTVLALHRLRRWRR
jgi:hypothetical protein